MSVFSGLLSYGTSITVFPHLIDTSTAAQVADHGIINSWDWTGTMVGDDDPVSKQFMHILEATQFKLVTSLSLTLYVSPKEFYVFRNEDM